MRAAIFHETGQPEVLTIGEVPVPEPGPDEVRVRVEAATLQPFDIAVRSGWVPPTVNLVFPIITGNEFAGTIDAVGDNVTGFSVGDRVAGRRMFGCAAEYLCVAATDIAVIPASISYPQAAYLGGTGQTAHLAVEFLEIQKDDTFLIHGAAGGVGSIAIQLAVRLGAHVIATGSPQNQDHLRSLGATPVVYGDGLRARIEAAAPEGISVALDCVGGEALDLSVSLVADRQRVATLNDYRRYKELGVQWPSGERNGQRLAALMQIAARDHLQIPIRRTYMLDEIVAAHRDVESGHGHGKVAVVIRA